MNIVIQQGHHIPIVVLPGTPPPLVLEASQNTALFVTR